MYEKFKFYFDPDNYDGDEDSEEYGMLMLYSNSVCEIVSPNYDEGSELVKDALYEVEFDDGTIIEAYGSELERL